MGLMSTVAILAIKLTQPFEESYVINEVDRLNNTSWALKTAFTFEKDDIIAVKIYYDGYPGGILNYIDENANKYWESLVTKGFRESIMIDSPSIGNPVPKVFKDLLSFDTWARESFDADYLYMLEKPYVKYKELNHFNSEKSLKIDYEVPDGPWQYFELS